MRNPAVTLRWSNDANLKRRIGRSLNTSGGSSSIAGNARHSTDPASAHDTTRFFGIEHMLNRRKIKEAPTWQRNLVLLLGSLAAATFLLFMAWAVMLFIAVSVQ
ncbi:MAG: hypothetical protein WBM76_13665 [Woeseiaceae bacterium]